MGGGGEEKRENRDKIEAQNQEGKGSKDNVLLELLSVSQQHFIVPEINKMSMKALECQH